VLVFNFRSDEMTHPARDVHIELNKSVLSCVNAEYVNSNTQRLAVKLQMIIHLLYQLNAIEQPFVFRLGRQTCLSEIN